MALNIGMERLDIIRPIGIRSQPLENLSMDDVKLMLQGNDFYHVHWYWMGKGIWHQYELLKGGKVVLDKTTDLTWQQSGSEKRMIFADVEQYIRDLNKQHFAGYNDWRLPTLEEVMSLMEPKQSEDGLCINSVFDKTQSKIWTADKESAGWAWMVVFNNGNCVHNKVRRSNFVRAVR